MASWTCRTWRVRLRDGSVAFRRCGQFGCGVTLREVAPRVLRVVDVPASSTLPELHELLQVAVGWTDSHLHQFVAGDIRYGVAHEEWLDDQVDEAGARLRGLPERFVYLYDFGDGWTHDVELLGPGADQPGCVYGEEFARRRTAVGRRATPSCGRCWPIRRATTTCGCATGPVSWLRSTRSAPTFSCGAPWGRFQPVCG